MSCIQSGPLEVQSWLYCALNRHYVTPEMKQVLESVAADVEQKFPGTKTLLLDANFPFLDGFPLLPHLSHDDGNKADIAFYYEKDGAYLPGATRSPVGYFAFEEGPTDCPKMWPTLRWDMAWLQPLFKVYDLELDRTNYALQRLAKDSRIRKIFIEPHLKAKLGRFESKIRFQGCRAARHDDHIHIQL